MLPACCWSGLDPAGLLNDSCAPGCIWPHVSDTKCLHNWMCDLWDLGLVLTAGGCWGTGWLTVGPSSLCVGLRLLNRAVVRLGEIWSWCQLTGGTNSLKGVQSDPCPLQCASSRRSSTSWLYLASVPQWSVDLPCSYSKISKWIWNRVLSNYFFYDGSRSVWDFAHAL